MAETPGRKVPSSRVGRMAQMGKMATGLATDLAGAAGKVAFGASTSRAAEQFHRQAAKTILENLGQMKGLPMKAGQMISFFDDMIPPGYRDIYREALEKLQMNSRPLRWAEIEQVIKKDLGQPPEKLFVEFSKEPIAAASIGQVYKAKLKDGRDVAVKVQYPSIADAVRSDIKNLDLLRNALSMVLPKVEMEQGLEDLSARVLEECDYGCELNNQEEFAKIWQGDSQVAIPAVISEFSRDHVLTMEFHGGKTWRETVASASQEDRNEYGEIIYRFVFRSLYCFGMFNADPHPGNYLFQPGKVVFLDFGCVQRYPKDFIDQMAKVRHLITAGVRGKELFDAAIQAWGLPTELDKEELAYLEEYLLCVYEPVLSKTPFRFSREYTGQLADLSLKGGMLFARKALTKGIRESKRPGFIFLNRIQYGLASVLAGLEAEADWAGITKEIDAERARIHS